MPAMIAFPSSPIAHAKRLAETSHALAMIAVVVIIANTAVQHFGEPTFDAMRAHDLTPDLAGALALFQLLLIHSVKAGPSLLLVGALLDLRVVLQEFEAGRFFTVRASAAVRGAGEWALWALGAKIMFAPTLYSILVGEPRGIVFKFESFDLGMLAFALFVMLAGRVLEEAAALKAENDSMI